MQNLLKYLSLLSLFSLHCSTPQAGNDFLAVANSEKHRGAHVFRINDSSDLNEIKDANIEWITIVPWAYQKTHLSAEVGYYHEDSEARAKRDSSYLHRIQHLHKEGFKVFLKPHIWITEPEDGKWRSDITQLSDSEWNSWSEDYRDFILRFAVIAKEAQAEMFCVGTELTLIAKEHPEYWRSLISEVRKIYKGKLTYAANWFKEYEKITFWEELEYIGVQAYFPLAKKDNPSLEEITKGWDKYLSDMYAVSKKFQRKILFTEMGYKSTADGATRPWEWMEHSENNRHSYSAETQTRSYQAFFDSVWKQDWFAGVHIWQMRMNLSERKNPESQDLNFTPQGKPAIEVIKKGFKK